MDQHLRQPTRQPSTVAIPPVTARDFQRAQPAKSRTLKSEHLFLPGLMNLMLASTLDLRSRVLVGCWSCGKTGHTELAIAYDEFGDDIGLYADLLGKRIAAMGGVPRGLSSNVIKFSRLPPFPDTFNDSAKLAAAIEQSVSVLQHYLETTLKAADAAGDTASVDVLQRLKRRLAVQSAKTTMSAPALRLDAMPA